MAYGPTFRLYSNVWGAWLPQTVPSPFGLWVSETAMHSSTFVTAAPPKSTFAVPAPPLTVPVVVTVAVLVRVSASGRPAW